MLRSDRSRGDASSRGDDGFSLVFMALIMVVLLGVAGLVVDLGSWQVEASRTKRAADAAALAGVVRLVDGDTAAITRAREIAADNGFTHGVDGVTVDVTVRNAESLAVSITKDGISQYFTQLFRGPPKVTRVSTAQYVQPVPLGSPRNYLGTGDLLSGVDFGNGPVTGNAVENFWLSISGGCTHREFGDRITPIAMANPGGTPYSCQPGVGPRLANPEFDANGYVFAAEVPVASGSAPVAIQMFDAPVCGGGISRAADGGTPAYNMNVSVRDDDDLDPLAGTLLTSRTFIGSNGATGDCGQGPAVADCLLPNALKNCWTTLYTATAPGKYFIQINPVFLDANTRHNNFSLRAKRNGTFIPCTGSPTTATAAVPYRDWCTNVYGFEHLPVWATGSTNPIFFLSSIDQRHNGKTMQVTLYDAAEGAQTIELLDPNGNPETFDWEVLCADGSRASGGSCTGEANPTGGRAGGPTSAMDVSGTGAKTFAANTQSGKYSDRLLRLSVRLPSDIATAYSGSTWWKIRYTCSSCGDRTTWSVQLLGDPVRLIPNA